jgi:hypothetical protein
LGLGQGGSHVRVASGDLIRTHLTSKRSDLVQYLKSRSSRARQWRLPFFRLACASSTLTGSARDIKRGLAGVAHVDSYLQSLGGEICLILPPSERTCTRLSQDVASPEALRNRKVINTKSAR